MKGILVVAVLACAMTANGALLTEDWESMGGGQNGWVVANGVWVGTYAAPAAPKGVSYAVGAGQTSRIFKQFDKTGQTELKLVFDFQDATDATTSQRHFGGFQNSIDGATVVVDAGLVRIGANNQADKQYQLHYYTTALQTVGTGVFLTPAQTWHHVEITVKEGSIDWKIDDKGGTVTNAALTLAKLPNTVTLGYNYSNGTSGSGVATYWDSISVTPEPAALALLGLGGLLFRRRRA